MDTEDRDADDRDSEIARATEAFKDELRRLRESRGWSRRRLADTLPVHPSYVSHIEAGRHRPTEDFARRADEALGAGGALVARWEQYRDARGRPDRQDLHAANQMLFETALWVESEEAEQRFDGETYTMTVRRSLYNVGQEPIIRYFMRINIDQFPDEIRRARLAYRPSRLSWEEIRLSAHCEDEEMAVERATDQDALKEVWLLFENPTCSFPLYPGERTVIEYSYRVPADKWGYWFQRAVRLPTRRLSIQLVFPRRYTPYGVWGTEVSMTVPRRPLRTPILRQESADEVAYRWETTNPPLSTRYRLEWSFPEADPPDASGPGPGAAGGDDPSG